MLRTSIKLVAVIGFSVVALLAQSSLVFAQQAFVDPAPPAVLDAGGREASSVATPELTFHAAPKPLPAGAAVSDWPCFLGPTHNGFSTETKLLQKFPANGPAMVWEYKKGEGYAQPIISNDRLILFHRVGDDEAIDCLDPSTGNRFWRNNYPTHYVDRYGYCNGPRSTPAIDGDWVYSIGAEGEFRCVNLKTGKLRWRRSLLADFKLQQNFFGIGASPLIDSGLVIVNVGAPHGPCVAAFDPATGKMVWGTGDQWGPSYASPVPATLHGKHRVLVFAGGESRPPTGGLMCIDPANGHVDFSFPWRGNRRESVNASSPVVIDDAVFISECYGSGGTLLDIDDHFSPKQLWINPNFGTHFMTAIPKDGYLYGIDGHGPEDAFLCCIDQKSGKEIWRKQPEWEEQISTRDGGQRKVTLGTYRCNLLMIDGRCLCLGEFGHLLWLDLNPAGYKELDRTWLFPAGETWTPPVVSHGLLYVCQNAQGSHGEPMRVVCYDLRGS